MKFQNNLRLETFFIFLRIFSLSKIGLKLIFCIEKLPQNLGIEHQKSIFLSQFFLKCAFYRNLFRHHLKAIFVIIFILPS